MKKILISIAIAVAAIYVLSGLIFANSLHILERELEKRLPELVGPAAKYQVKIKDTDIVDVVSGQINELYLFAEKVTPRECPQLESVKVHLHNVLFDMDKIEKIENANFIIVVDEDSINKYIPLKLQEYPDTKVELKDGLAVLNTSKKFFNFNLPVKISGILEVKNYKQVNFKCSSLAVSGIPIPDFALKYIEEKINPLVDLTQIKIVTDITDIKILAKKIQVEGRAEVLTPLYYGNN